MRNPESSTCPYGMLSGCPAATPESARLCKEAWEY
jgi:hypothetical protein